MGGGARPLLHELLGPRVRGAHRDARSRPGSSAWWSAARALRQGRIHLRRLCSISANAPGCAGRVPAAGKSAERGFEVTASSTCGLTTHCQMVTTYPSIPHLFNVRSPNIHICLPAYGYVTGVSRGLEEVLREATFVTTCGERLNEKPFEGDGDLHTCVGHGDRSSAD